MQHRKIPSYGFNFALCGFKTVEEFWIALGKTEAQHLNTFCLYVTAMGIDKDLRAHNWAEFARRYNGPEYKKNQYDIKLAKAYAKSSGGATPKG